MIFKSKNFAAIVLFGDDVYTVSPVWYGDNDTLVSASNCVYGSYNSSGFKLAVYDKFGNYYPIKK